MSQPVMTLDAEASVARACLMLCVALRKER